MIIPGILKIWYRIFYTKMTKNLGDVQSIFTKPADLRRKNPDKTAKLSERYGHGKFNYTFHLPAIKMTKSHFLTSIAKIFAKCKGFEEKDSQCPQKKAPEFWHCVGNCGGFYPGNRFWVKESPGIFLNLGGRWVTCPPCRPWR